MPVMATDVPPLALPVLGVIELTVGGGLPEELGAGRRTMAAVGGHSVAVDEKQHVRSGRGQVAIGRRVHVQ